MLVRIFEWETLRVGFEIPGSQEVFTQVHFDSLAQWESEKNLGYFQLKHKKICFTQWVGVIQLGTLTIEILPKADKNQTRNREESIDHWSKVMMKMLKLTGQVKLQSSTLASLSTSRQSLLDIYLQNFLFAVETLIHRGLVKKYTQVSKNRSCLKGQLQFPKQLVHNAIRRDRFHTQANEFERENTWNQMLVEALKVIFKMTSNGTIRSKAKELELFFPEWSSRKFVADDFDRLVYDRKTEPYREAIQLAQLILMEMNPQLKSGTSDVVAIFFDMNELFERYVAKVLEKQLAEKSQKTGRNLLLKTQRPQKYLLMEGDTWKFMMKPDLTIMERLNGSQDWVPIEILDTKWKLLDGDDPKLDIKQADLYQMYTYGGEYGCGNLTLIYPEWAEGCEDRVMEYENADMNLRIKGWQL